MTDSFHDKLMQGGGIGVKSASFDGQPGIVHRGYILALTTAPDIDPKTKQPAVWPSGEKKPDQIVVIIQDQDVPVTAEDDGQRAIYLDWKKREAVQNAVKAAAEQDPNCRFDVGGYLAIQFVSQDPPKSAGLSGVKHYVAAYQAPAASAINQAAGLLPQQAAPAAAPVAAAPAPAPAAQPAQAFNPASLLPPQ